MMKNNWIRDGQKQIREGIRLGGTKKVSFNQDHDY